MGRGERGRGERGRGDKWEGTVLWYKDNVPLWARQ